MQSRLLAERADGKAGAESRSLIHRAEREALRLIDVSTARRHGVLPLRQQNKLLEVATSEPQNLHLIDTLSYLTSLQIAPIHASRREIEHAIEILYSADGQAQSLANTSSEISIQLIKTELEETFLAILEKAHAARASDIHFEPMATSLRVRYRIDGVLQRANVPPTIHRFAPAIISRLKIMANLDIAEKRLPQDGRLNIQSRSGHPLHFRVSTLPTLYGEAIALRLIATQEQKPRLDAIGLGSHALQKLHEALNQSDGLILVTGPTGSGKTTTLYAALQALDPKSKKIITVEDPIEYAIPWVNQTHARPHVGFTFASALRSILRQAPNIIMIGEIRDRETASVAAQAAHTGHLVLSTLHTPDSVASITRLIDMGVAPSLLSLCLRAVLSQRLIRKLCVKCRAPHPLQERELRLLGLEPSSEITRFFRPAGCDTCAASGYQGRIGLFELLSITPAMSAAIRHQASITELRHLARDEKLQTLLQDGAQKVIEGVSSVEEVLAATYLDAIDLVTL